MKKIQFLILLIGFTQFLVGCSQGHRSHAYSAAQQHEVAQQKRQQQIKMNNAKIASASIQSHAKHSSQQAQKRVVANQHPARDLMTRIAYSTIGTRYKWGGNNPQQGFDCSGLMKYIYKNATGMDIPRTAAQQRDASRTINYQQLQPGDMLFFKTSKTANHVGVYVGNRKFVHAATGSAHVKVASMDSKYWHSRFVKFGTFL